RRLDAAGRGGGRGGGALGGEVDRGRSRRDRDMAGRPDALRGPGCGAVSPAHRRHRAVRRRRPARRRDAPPGGRGDRRPRPPPAGAAARDARTLVEAAPDGWWYAALVPSGERVVAYFTDADLADRAALLTPEGFLARLDRSRLVREALSSHGSTLADRPRIT